MKANLQSTNKLVNINDVTARLWEGETETGMKVSAFIVRVAVDQDSELKVKQQLFDELQQCVPPSDTWRDLPNQLFI